MALLLKLVPSDSTELIDPLVSLADWSIEMLALNLAEQKRFGDAEVLFREEADYWKKAKSGGLVSEVTGCTWTS